jgi:signal transduction histidine kinase
MIWNDHEGSVWFATEGGASRFDGSQFHNFTSSNDRLASDSVLFVGRDSRRNLLFGTDSGVTRYDGKVWSSLDSRDGLAGDRGNHVLEDADGSYWFSTDRGLTHYHPRQTKPQRPLVSTILDTQTFAAGTELPPIEEGRSVRFKLDVNDLRTRSETRRFRYQVVAEHKTARDFGDTNNWTLAGKTSEITWSADKPGPFTVAVQYIDRDMNYSPLALVPLTIFTPWYANARVMLPGGGAIGGLVIWAFVARSLVARGKREAEQLREQLLQEEQKARKAAETSALALAAKNDELDVARRTAEEAKQGADKANKAKSQFLASMSHELRTPLNAIIGYSEMVQEVAQDDGNQDYVPDLQKIQAAAKHQLSLINDILDLSKIEAGKMTLFVEEFDVANLLREVEATVQPLMARNANRLEVVCPADIGTMRADQTKVRQTLFNLLSNASKFTEKGTIGLEAKRTSAPDQIIFRVSDSGIGLRRRRRSASRKL